MYVEASFSSTQLSTRGGSGSERRGEGKGER